MRTLDRYIARNFLSSAVLCFVAFMSLRIVVDLAINMDEFAKQDLKFGELVGVIATYYGHQSLAYFNELGGLIIVVAATFTLARMNLTNELTAMLASGVSLRRVVLPIVLCAAIVSLVIVADQELVIPRFKHKLVRDRDDVQGEGLIPVRLLPDGTNAVWQAKEFRPAEDVMERPVLVLRNKDFAQVGSAQGHVGVPARIGEQAGWRLIRGTLSRVGQGLRPWRKNPRWDRIHTRIGPARMLAVLARGAGRQLRGLKPRAQSGEYRVYGAGPVTLLRWSRQPPSGNNAVRDVAGEDAAAGVALSARSFEPDPYRPGHPRLGTLRRPRFTFLGPDKTPLAVLRADSAVYRYDDGRGRGHWRVDGAHLEGVSAWDPEYGLRIEAKELLVDPPQADRPPAGTLLGPRFTFRTPDGQILGIFLADRAAWTVDDVGETWWRLDDGALFYPTDLAPADLKLRQSRRWMDYMSTRELTQLLRLGRVLDRPRTALARHVRFTDPLNNIVMLLLAVPFILSRERNIKASATFCLLMVGVFYVFIYACRQIGLPPTLGAWLPVLLFGPVAAVMVDSVKT